MSDDKELPLYLSPRAIADILGIPASHSVRPHARNGCVPHRQTPARQARRLHRLERRMPIKRRKRGGPWYTVVKVDGRWERKTTGVTSKEAALRILEERGRHSELASALPGDIDTAKGFIFLRSTKTKKHGTGDRSKSAPPWQICLETPDFVKRWAISGARFSSDDPGHERPRHPFRGGMVLH